MYTIISRYLLRKYCRIESDNVRLGFDFGTYFMYTTTTDCFALLYLMRQEVCCL